MFVKNSFADEIANSMMQNLDERAGEKRASEAQKMVKIADRLNEVAELCDDLGLETESEIVTALIQNICLDKTAAKKKKPTINDDFIKAKKKSKTKAKDKAKALEKKVKRQSNSLKNLPIQRAGKEDEDEDDDNDAEDHNCAYCGGYGSSDENLAFDDFDTAVLDEDYDEIDPKSDHGRSNEEMLALIQDLNRSKFQDASFEDEWDEDLLDNGELDQGI